jgi:hypothetical protein
MWPLYKKAREHPAVSVPLAAIGGFVSVYLLAASLWGSVYVDKPFLPTVWAAATSVTPTLSFGTVWMIILVAILGLSVSVIGAVAVSAVQNRKMATRLQGEVDGLRALLATATQDNARLTTQRDLAVVALEDKKRDFALDALRRYSRMKFDDKTPTVTIRHCSYVETDYELVEQLKNLFELYANWTVTIDGKNDPSLPRAGKCKVMFDVGCTLSYDDLLFALSQGNLLGVVIGSNKTSRLDVHNLIVEVLPSAPSERASGLSGTLGVS